MAVEDIVISMGLDSRPVSEGLRKVRREVSGFGDSLRKINLGRALSGSLRMAGGMLAGGAVAGAMAKVTQMALRYADEINDLRDATGASAVTLQAWAIQVDRSGGNAEAAGKAIEKFAVQLGEARNEGSEAAKKFEDLGLAVKNQDGTFKTTDQALGDFMDRVKSGKDEVERITLAASMFGDKLGSKVVGALKEGSAAFAEFKKNSAGSILSDADVDRLAMLSDGAKGIMHWVKVRAAKILSASSTVLFGDAKTDLLAKRFGTPTEAPTGDTDYAAKASNAKKVAEALEKLDKVRRDLRLRDASEAQKLVILQQEEAEIREKISRTERDSLENIQLRTALAEKEKDIREQMDRAQEKELDFQKRKTEQKQKQVEQAEKERRTLLEINEAEGVRADRAAELQREKTERSKFTLGELAALQIQGGTTRQMAGEILAARRVQWLENRARLLAGAGYETQSQALLGFADQMRGGLSALTQKERTPYASMEKSAAETVARLDEIIARSKSEGINVQVIPAP